MSARSSGGIPYTAAWTCPQVWSNAAGAGVAFTPTPFTVPASAASAQGLLASLPITNTTHGLRVSQLVLPLAAITSLPAGATSALFCAAFVSTSETQLPASFNPTLAPPPTFQLQRQCTTVTAPSPTATQVTIDLTAAGAFPGGLELGPAWSGTLQLTADTGTTLTYLAATASSPATSPACFSPAVGTALQLSLALSAGGPLGWLAPMSGSSAAALVASQAVLARQYFTDGFFPSGAPTPGAGFAPSAALLKAVLINSASPLLAKAFGAYFQGAPPTGEGDGVGAGFGVPNLLRGLPLAGPPGGPTPPTTLLLPGLALNGSSVAAEPAIVTQGQQHTYCVDVVSSGPAAPGAAAAPGLPLAFTLVWADPPALPGAANTLVNNLDLAVRPPPGTGLPQQLAGNTGNISDPAAQAPDTSNNVESLRLPAPVATVALQAGGAAPVRLAPAYKVLVTGAALPVAPQPYSLVVTGPGTVLLSTLNAATGVCEALASPSASPSASPPPPQPPAAAATVPAVVAIAGFSVLGAALVGAGVAITIIMLRRGAGSGAPAAATAWGAAKSPSTPLQQQQQQPGSGSVVVPNVLHSSQRAGGGEEAIELPNMPSAGTGSAVVAAPAAGPGAAVVEWGKATV